MTTTMRAGALASADSKGAGRNASAANVLDQPIRIDRFTTARQEPEGQFARWRDLVSPILDVSQVETPRPGFRAAGRAYDLGALHLVSARMDPMAFRHGEDHVATSGIDHWCLTLVKGGVLTSQGMESVVEARAGSLDLKSLAYPFAGRANETDVLSLYLQRDDFSEIAEAIDAACFRRLTGSMANILKDFLVGVETRLAVMTVSDISLLVETLTLLLRALVAPTADALAAAERPVSVGRFNLARKYIQDNLASSDLGADSICKALNLSRRQLYYLFEPHGGVAGFIKQRRLTAACRALANSKDHRLISTIAYSYGYTNQSLFSRHFQAEFGFTPREARQARLCGHLPRRSPPRTFSDWLLRAE